MGIVFGLHFRPGGTIRWWLVRMHQLSKVSDEELLVDFFHVISCHHVLCETFTLGTNLLHLFLMALCTGEGGP